jgi:hypothetical protein
MKNMIRFTIIIAGVLAMFSACKKQCGHCINSMGQREPSVCKSPSFSVSGLDNYDQAEFACKNNGGRWQIE